MSKIRRVTLYKHGVGFFEVAHEVEGDAEVCLNFKVEEMNDVLKSLTVHDPAGTVISVSYDSHKAIAQLLQEIALELPKTGGGAALLARLQGAEVVVQTPTRQMRGSVVGLEPRTSKVGDQILQENWLTLWTEAHSLVNLNMADVQSLELCDETLRSDLGYCLDVLLKTHKRDAKQLSIFTRGQGNRQLQVSYLVEAPAWKSSYRILLPEKPDQPPFWEGWALVDNPRDEDWEDVELTLVAGLPVSFRHDLYSPRYVERKEIKVEREAVVGPVQVAGAVPRVAQFAADPFAAAAGDPFASEAGDAFAVSSAPADPFAMSLDPFATTPPEVARQRAAQVVAQSSGELFHYRLRHPVTVKRNQSALVPIVGQEASGGKVLLYNAQERSNNPFAAVELTNTTGLTLEGGPLLVIEENSYAGEAMLDTLKPDDRRIVAYAVDLAVLVESQQNQRRDTVHLVRAQAGFMTMYMAEIESTTYVFKNNDARDKILWIEHPLRRDWELHETPPEEERSATHYRFRTQLAAHAQMEFRVMLKRVVEQGHFLGHCNPEQLKLFRRGGYFTPEAEATIEKLTMLMEERNQTQLEMQRAEQRGRELTADIERCRSMLPSLSTTGDESRLRSNYVQSMEQGEEELKETRAKHALARAKLGRQSDEIARFSGAIQFEKTL